MPSTQEPQRISQDQSTSSSHTAYRPQSVHTSKLEDIVDSLSITATDVDAKIIITFDSNVSAGGASFSQDQRQLIALAQALLLHS